MTRRLLAIVLGALVLLPAAPASAATRDKIIKDCADDGVLQGSYTPSELRDARQNLPSDIAEYTDCADVLRRAELPDRGGAPGTGGTATSSGVPGFDGSGGSFPGGGAGGAPGLIVPSTDADRQALAAAAEAGEQPLEVRGQSVTPGAAGLRTEAVRSDLPGSLLIALGLLALLGAALSAPGVRRLAGPRLPSLRLPSAFRRGS